MGSNKPIVRSRQTRRRTHSAVLGLFVLMLGSLFTAGAAYSQAVVAFDPPNGSVDCGQSIFVDVTIDNAVTDLRGFSFTFQFDPTYVTPIAVTEGGALTGAPCATFFRWLNESSFTNTVEIDGSLLGCSIPGPGTILTIEFAATANRGQSALTVLASRFRDSNNADIPIVLPAGTIDNICNTAPVTVDDDYVVAEGGTITAVALGSPAGVLDNDSDFNNDTLTATVITPPANASAFTLNGDGSFSYTHIGDETTSDSFVYQADDGFGGLTQGTANIVITGVNDPPVVTNPGNQSSADTDVISLQIVATDAELAAMLYTAAGLPGGLSIDLNTGLISGAIDCDASLLSPYNVTVDVDDSAPLGVTQIAFIWTVTPQAAPAAIADLAGTQVKVGNDSDGTTQITLTWTGGTAAVYRKGFGFYPEYDDNGGAAPLAPVSAAQAVIQGWVLVPSVVASGSTDESALRDFYYYVAFAVSSCGTESGVSNLSGGVLNYHLGDVTDGVTPGTGDNLVDSADVSLLGFSYNVDSADALYLNFLDVGPTTDFSPDGRPITDDWIEFEDLMMFSLNYGAVS
ncbi:MAG: VCBS repeat-containing protein, partial [Candidatus Krumholzibacteriia bacterium]